MSGQPRLKTARGFGVVFYSLLIGLSVLCMLSMYLIEQYLPTGYQQMLAQIGVFVALAGLLVTVGLRRLRAFKCPDCRAPLGNNQAAAVPALFDRKQVAENAILYHCKHCNIVWDTGVRNNTD